MKRLQTAVLILACSGVCVSGGCVVGELFGAMAASSEREGSKEVKAQYKGLPGKSFAVVVAADRSIQADYPELIPRLTEEVSKRLAEHSGASKICPPAAVLDFQYNHPRWVTMTQGQLAEALGVERLVFIDMISYRLNDAGNKYVWDGAAAGTVSVCEAESSFPDEPAFQKPIKVVFPDKTGMTPEELPRIGVHSELSRRFADRVAWLFYTHEEPNKLTY